MYDDQHLFSAPPVPEDPREAERWQLTRFLRRVLTGRWGEDLYSRMLRHFGRIRVHVIGPQSLAKNPYKRLASGLAALYPAAPRLLHPDGARAEDFAGARGLLAQTGVWARQAGFQTDVLGMQEGLIKLDLVGGRVVHRPIYPDQVVGVEDPSRPGELLEARILSWEKIPGGRGFWAWHHFSIRDPSRPFYRVTEARGDGQQGADLSGVLLGGALVGPRYPWRWTQGARAGAPWLPLVLYHSQPSACLWNPHRWIEVADAVLDLGALWSFWGHSVFKASWPQRYAAGAYIPGAKVVQDGGRARRVETVSDPTSLIQFMSEENYQGQPVISQWGPGAEVDKLAQAILAYERSLADAIEGVDQANLTRDSADAWSGAALSINREGRREAQNVYRVPFALADHDLVEKSAALTNLGRLLPRPAAEEGYTVVHSAIPLSGRELRDRRDHNNEMIDRGRMSVVDAYQEEHPGLSRDDSIRELERIRVDNQRYRAPAAPASSPAAPGGAPGAPRPGGGAQVIPFVR